VEDGGRKTGIDKTKEMGKQVGKMSWCGALGELMGERRGKTAWWIASG